MRFGTSVCLKNDVLDSEMEHSPSSLKCQFECLGVPKSKGIPLGVYFVLLTMQLFHGEPSRKFFLDTAGKKHRKKDRR